jgi:hypothetical protein
LALLESREFIRRHATSAFAGTGEYVFKHQLMQQVAYEGVLKALRSDWHSRAADWIATQTGERAGEHLATAAEHYDRAGDARRASEHHERAAAWAAVRGAHRSMLRSVERGLALAAADDFALRWRLIGHRERFNVTSDDRLAHAADLDALEAIAEASDDNAKRADVL